MRLAVIGLILTALAAFTFNKWEKAQVAEMRPVVAVYPKTLSQEQAITIVRLAVERGVGTALVALTDTDVLKAITDREQHKFWDEVLTVAMVRADNEKCEDQDTFLTFHIAMACAPHACSSDDIRQHGDLLNKADLYVEKHGTPAKYPCYHIEVDEVW